MPSDGEMGIMFMTEDDTFLINAATVTEATWEEWEERLQTLEELIPSGSIAADTTTNDDNDECLAEPVSSGRGSHQLSHSRFREQVGRCTRPTVY